MDKIFAALTELAIPFTAHTHPPVFTSAEATLYYDAIPGARVKNLFLRNRKGDRHYLVIVLDAKQVDLKQLAQRLGEKQLGFASPERLKQYLNVTPGSVSALGLVFDQTHGVHVIIDADCTQYDSINMHPNDNTQTLNLSVADLHRFLVSRGNPVQILSL